ncbi:MAG: hypothetical protein V1773_12645 [bacterium]
MHKNILLSVLLAVTILGCDILTTREPEKPELARTTLFPATTPQILFNNLVESLSQKVTENYLSCIADSSLSSTIYKFFPASGAVNKYSVLSEWVKDSERRYFNNLKTAVIENQPITLTLLNENSNMQGDSAIYQFDYIITLRLTGTNQEIFKGNAQFKIRIDRNNTWVIAEWTDISIQGYSSWSELKGRYYL